jgi:hypothetical protein
MGFNMTRFFSSILFSFFLFLNTSSVADENATTSPIAEEDNQTDVHIEEIEQEEKEELSELEKEALAAEEAELREAGMEMEPQPE